MYVTGGGWGPWFMLLGDRCWDLGACDWGTDAGTQVHVTRGQMLGPSYMVAQGKQEALL